MPCFFGVPTFELINVLCKSGFEVSNGFPVVQIVTSILTRNDMGNVYSLR